MKIYFFIAVIQFQRIVYLQGYQTTNNLLYYILYMIKFIVYSLRSIANFIRKLGYDITIMVTRYVLILLFQ